MDLVLLAVISVCVFAVMFKVCNLLRADIHIAMTANYIIGSLLFVKDAFSAGSGTVFLGSIAACLFVAGFLLREHCTGKCGVALTSIAAKSSLLIPVVLGWLVLGQHGPSWTACAVIIAGIVMLSYGEEKRFRFDLIILFAVYGLCNFALPLAKYLGMGSAGTVGCIFLAAAAISFIMCIRKPPHIEIKSLAVGAVMGIANAASVYYSLEALATMNATLFYPIFNGAVVVICTLIGIVIFKERPEKIQIAGLATAAIGTIMATFAQ